MNRDDFLKLFPRASESVIRANVTEAAPLPPSRVQMPVKAKETKPARKPSKRVLTPRTRNAGTMTEAAYWSAIRSLLRGFSMRNWKPRSLALKAAKIPFNGPNNQRFAYRCCVCRGAFKRDDVEVDHVEGCGKLSSHDQLGPFVARLLAEDPSAWRVMCVPCHQQRTNEQRGIAPPAPTLGL